jgi:hypothetical protein
VHPRVLEPFNLMNIPRSSTSSASSSLTLSWQGRITTQVAKFPKMGPVGSSVPCGARTNLHPKAFREDRK